MKNNKEGKCQKVHDYGTNGEPIYTSELPTHSKADGMGFKG